MALIITRAGLSALSVAETTGTKITATHMAIGDGGGQAVAHTVDSETLVREKWRGELQEIREVASGEVEFVAHIPFSVGGWYVREVALYADDTLLAIGSHPDVWKPAPEAPDKVELLVTAPVQFTNSDTINLTVDTTKVLASQEMVADAIADHDADEAAHSGLLAAVSDHAGRTDNPHGVTKEQVGLDNIPNATSDSFNLNNPNYLATAKAVYDAYQALFGALPGAASTTEAGTVELLTNAEALLGTDQTKAASAANLLAVLNARGLWGNGVLVPKVVDFDTLTTTGVFYAQADAANVNYPPAGPSCWYVVFVLVGTVNALIQIALPLAATNDPRIFIRRKVNSWQAWETIVTNNNGVVSSKGTRTTTGTWTLTGLTVGKPVIIEYGGGTQPECALRVTSGAEGGVTTNGSFYLSSNGEWNRKTSWSTSLIPSAATVTLEVISITADSTLRAYQ